MKGIICPILTPFNNDLSFNGDLYLKHAQDLLDSGIHFISPFGTTGEALSMSVAERINAVDCLVDGGISPSQIMPGAGLCNFPETLELVRHAVNRGCLAVMLLPPFFYKNATDEGQFTYFARLIDALSSSHLKICLYHIPPMAGMGFSPELTRKLSIAFPETVVAYKDSSGLMEHTLTIRSSAPSLSVFPGSEFYLKKGLENGCAGCISATCNINSQAIRDVYDIYFGDKQGNLEDSNEKILDLRRKVDAYSPIAVMKGYLAHNWQEERWRNVRPPLLPSTDQEIASLLRKIG
ncbi:MAG: dihydrodipicolinate synthase family protein [Gammaproteobacteria bacterium]|nr:dihydrodipicolinate synthase family protein [Gammaproteobacteria bacterium]MCY4227889.1 dihydrodipicolinate synthase family protein [Gammaproteobacteria bacterium]